MPFAAHDLHLIVALPKRPAPLRKKYAPNRNQPKHSSCFIDDKIRLLLSGDSQPPAQRETSHAKPLSEISMNGTTGLAGKAPPFIHPQALVDPGASVGPGTRVWQFCVILSGAIVGEDCNICSHCLIEGGVKVGSRVTVKSGVQLWDGVTLEDDVFVGSNATFTNDPYPRSKQYPEAYTPTIVEAGASIGANATILPGLRIGRGAMVAAGAVVTRDVPAHGIVKGNPARLDSFDASNALPIETRSLDAVQERSRTDCGVEIIALQKLEDFQGELISVEMREKVPFTVARILFVTDVPSQRISGERAHRTCHEMLLCLTGSVFVTVDNGTIRETHLLDTPKMGLHIPPMIWASQYNYSGNAVLAVFTSQSDEVDDDIRDYPSFLKTLQTGQR